MSGAAFPVGTVFRHIATSARGRWTGSWHMVISVGDEGVRAVPVGVADKGGCTMALKGLQLLARKGYIEFAPR